MKQDLKEKWVAALRSGQFQQGTRYLRIKDKYCCLGVLIHCVYGDKGLVNPDPRGIFSTAGHANRSTIPVDMCEDIEIEHSVALSLAGMNDSGKSFEEIAVFIEDNI